MIYEVYSDNELSKQIRLLKKTEKTFHVLFTNPSDKKSNYLTKLFNNFQTINEYTYSIPYDIIIVSSFNCPSGFMLGNFHITKTPTLVSFGFDPHFGYSVTEDQWVSYIEEVLELV